jgi:Flp pilus assembly pilin Flp
MAVKRRMPPKSKLSSTLTLLRARLVAEEEGATGIEYVWMASGIGTAVAATAWSLGSTTLNLYASLAAML